FSRLFLAARPRECRLNHHLTAFITFGGPNRATLTAWKRCAALGKRLDSPPRLRGEIRAPFPRPDNAGSTPLFSPKSITSKNLTIKSKMPRALLKSGRKDPLKHVIRYPSYSESLKHTEVYRTENGRRQEA